MKESGLKMGLNRMKWVKNWIKLFKNGIKMGCEWDKNGSKMG